MTVTVRSLDESGRAIWDPLWQGYLAFYEVALEPAVTEATWRRLIDPAKDMHGLGAFDPAGAMTGRMRWRRKPPQLAVRQTPRPPTQGR